MSNDIDHEIEAVSEEELRDLKHIASVFSANYHRSIRLLKFSYKSNDQIGDKEAFLAYMFDVARATVVFLHSSLETMLREIVRLKLQYDSDVSYIPLGGQSAFANRKDRFTLGDLAKHRGKTVDKVIQESVDEYLSNLSFNNTKDITDTFARLNLPQKTLNKYYSSLEMMISRRHQIVHEGDWRRGSTALGLEPIMIEEVDFWADSASDFCAEVIRIIIDAVYVDKIVKRLNVMGIPIKREDIARSINVNVSINE